MNVLVEKGGMARRDTQHEDEGREERCNFEVAHQASVDITSSEARHNIERGSLDIMSERKISILRRVASLNRAWLDIIKPRSIISSEA